MKTRSVSIECRAGSASPETISVSQGATLIAVIVGNPTMIDAYKSGIPENGKPLPDGARMARIQESRLRLH